MKKIGLLVLALVMALGALGVGYAYWTQPVTLTANVDMGNLEATIESPAVVAGIGNGANLTAVASNVNPDDGVELVITATNIYPGWSGLVTFNVRNTGTMPIYLTRDMSATGAAAPGIAGEATVSPLNADLVGIVDFNGGTGGSPYWVTGTIAPGATLSGMATVAFASTATLGQDALTADTATDFVITFPFVAHQFNQPTAPFIP